MCARQRGGTVSHDGDSLPIYGDLLTFARTAPARPLSRDGVGHRRSAIRSGRGDGHAGRLRPVPRRSGSCSRTGQPVEHAHIPTLELHIAMLRDWILDAGIPLVEIPPIPAGHRFCVCLTHDIDFVGIRQPPARSHDVGVPVPVDGRRRRHAGSGGRISVGRLLQDVARGRCRCRSCTWAGRGISGSRSTGTCESRRTLPATYFLIPFKGRAGRRRRRPARRAPGDGLRRRRRRRIGPPR